MNERSANRPTVAVLDAPGAGPWPGLEPLAAHAEVRHADDLPSLRRAIADARVLCVTDFRGEALEGGFDRVLALAPRLEWIHATSAGVDAIMTPALARSQIAVTNARGFFDRAIAEYVLGLVILFAKDLLTTLRLQRERRWRHRDTERIDGKHAVIVGAGSIGHAIGDLLAKAGMRISGIARSARPDPLFEQLHGPEALPELLPTADYVVIAAPLTEQTEGMFDAAALARMKPGARLINIGRGAIVDTDALVAALDADALAGAALDVFHEEPLPSDHPLWTMDDVVVSPHMAGDFVGWREALSAAFIANFERWRSGEPLHNLVDR